MIRNQLTSLDADRCTALCLFGCTDNKLSATALNNIFTALRSEVGRIDVSGNIGDFDYDGSMAIDKGWPVFWVNQDLYSSC
jgi:hypothetical protein